MNDTTQRSIRDADISAEGRSIEMFMERLKENAKIGDAPSPSPMEQALSVLERNPAGRISPLIAGRLHDENVINDWELEFLLNTAGQEPCFTTIQLDDLRLPPLSYSQTLKRVLIALKVLRYHQRINDEHYRYLEKIQATA